MKAEEILEIEGRKYIAKDTPILIGGITVDAGSNAYKIPDAEAVEMATKQKHLVLIPYIGK